MSSRRSSSGITEDQITDLLSKLQHHIPQLRRSRSHKISASKVLQETCNYIRSLHREVDDLRDRSQLLASADIDTDQHPLSGVYLFNKQFFSLSSSRLCSPTYHIDDLVNSYHW